MSTQTKLLTLAEIEAKIINKKGKCTRCDREIRKGSIKNYDHSGGIPVKGFNEKQWVYFRCYRCSMDSSIGHVMHKITTEKLMAKEK